LSELRALPSLLGTDPRLLYSLDERFNPIG
jgi:hypothetical protein